MNKLIDILQIVLARAWNNNNMPKEWIDTTQVPIPKISFPKSVDDFRRITITNAIYKIYARFLLSELQKYAGEIPLYQAGFLRNRSTDDHIFTVRRVIEERWRKGLLTHVIAIDLKKAFDRIDLSVVGTILKSYGVPCKLINRIIAASLHERTAIQWVGRRTNAFTKGKGVKQGCPISPYIFIILLDYALKKVATKLNIDLNFREILLPILLVC